MTVRWCQLQRLQIGFLGVSPPAAVEHCRAYERARVGHVTQIVRALGEYEGILESGNRRIEVAGVVIGLSEDLLCQIPQVEVSCSLGERDSFLEQAYSLLALSCGPLPGGYGAQGSHQPCLIANVSGNFQSSFR